MGEAPVNGLAKAANFDHLNDFLAANPSIEFIRFQWLDFSASLMIRVATKDFALSLARRNSPISLPTPILSGLLIDRSLLLEDLDIGEDQLWADWSTLRVCHYRPGNAQVMCFVHEGGYRDGKGFRRCPRTRLQEITASAKTKHDMKFLVGVEIEFYIMDESKGSLEPVTTVQNPYRAASLNNKYLAIVEEIVRSISSAGIKVRQFHTEGESGQYEISTQPLEPLQAEDALIYCQEAIKNVCTQHGLRATMFPKPFEKRGGNGIHHHLSISRTDKEEYFLAGLLEHWGALAAFYMPNFDSNSRLRPNEWVSWGYENKTQAIRKIKEGHWELRGIDATANPHMTMTAILTAGLLGLESEKELTIKDPMKFALMGFDDKEAEDLGFKDKMPTSLKEALSRLKADDALRDALGPEIIDRYLKVKTKEEEIFSKLTRSERVEISMQLF